MEWDELDKLKGLPEISYVGDSVFRMINYDEISGTIEPVPGECEVFDFNKKEFDFVLSKLEGELQKWKDFFNCPKVKFVSVRAKNEIEVPKSAIKKEGKTHPHKDLIFSSEIAGAVRYVTAESSALSSELAEY
jgi:hypothetical protein